MSKVIFTTDVQMILHIFPVIHKYRGVISQNILVVPILDKIKKNAYFANSYIVNSENIGSARALWAH